MLHKITVEISRLKVETGLKLGGARLPVEGLKKNTPFRGGFQPNGQRRLKKENIRGLISTGRRETSAPCCEAHP